jgi:hypothetical protein
MSLDAAATLLASLKSQAKKSPDKFAVADLD